MILWNVCQQQEQSSTECNETCFPSSLAHSYGEFVLIKTDTCSVLDPLPFGNII